MSPQDFRDEPHSISTRKLRNSKLYLALCTALSSFTVGTAYAADTNVTVLNLLERSNSSPASMCFTLSQGQSVLNDIDNLTRFIELRQLPATAATNATSSTATNGATATTLAATEGATSAQATAAQANVGTLIDGNPTLDQGLLCVSGLSHGTPYELTLKQGLTFTSGDKLAQDVRVPFTISDASAQIKLPYNIILPKNAANSSFNVQTINQPSFKLSIYKLSTRSINQLNLPALLNNELSTWTLRQLLSDSAHKVYDHLFNLASNSSIDLMALPPLPSLMADAEQASLAANTAADAAATDTDNDASAAVTTTANAGNAQNSTTAGTSVSGPTAGLKQAVQAAMVAQLSPEQKNKGINTNIALKQFMSNADDGMYLIVASDPRLNVDDLTSFYNLNNTMLPLSAKLMMITDLGLSTYKSADGLLVSVRSLTTAQSLPGVNLQLIAHNNEVLAQSTTNEQGVARFSAEAIAGKNALAPRALIALHKNDTYSLDLNSAPLYLEDNTGARSLPLSNDSDSTPNLQTYAYTERGIYRAGETVHFTALVRNAQLQGVNLPLTLRVLNPYQNAIKQVLLKEPKMGGYEYDFTLPEGTPQGTYAMQLRLGDNILSNTYFTVGSFVPTQINSAFANDEKLIALNTPFTLRTTTNFNYGSRASNLNGMFTLTLRPDPHPVPRDANAANNEFLNQFHFGPDSRKYSELQQMEQFFNLKTNVQGELQQNITLKASEYPRIADVTATVFDTNGQPVAIEQEFKVAYNQPLIGVRLLKSSDTPAEIAPLAGGAPAAQPRPADSSKVSTAPAKAPSAATTNFALCSYMQDGSTFPQDVKYYLYKEFTDYNYVYDNGAWRFVSFVGRNLVNQGSVRVNNQQLNAAAISVELDDGTYVLELESDKSRTTYSFVKGFSSSHDALTPDRIALYADKEQYELGDKAKLSFDSPFAGYANLALGSNGISDFKTFKVEKGHNEIEVNITAEMYPQGHALLSIFSPLPRSQATTSPSSGNNNQGSTIGAVADATTPIRAVGLCDLNLNLAAHQLQVTTTAPAEVKPQSPLRFTVKAVPVDSAALGVAGSTAKQAVQEAQVDGLTQGRAQKPGSASALEEAASGYAKVTLVDNGVLALTSYKAPDPNKVLMQDRAYEVNLYDAYGYLMTNPLQTGQGYGATAEKAMLSMDAAAAVLEAIPFKTVALASKIVPLNAQGEGEVEFAVPQFSGSLKVMAVAWNEEQTGASNQDVLIRDKAVATLGLPRFLNAGDEVQARLNLHNLKASDPNFKIDIRCDGALKCSEQAVSSLKPGLREDHFFTIKTYGALGKDSADTTEQLGVGTIHLKVMNPEYSVHQDYNLTVTSPRLPLLKNYVVLVPAHESTTFDLGQDFTQLSGVAISKGLLPNVNPSAYTAQIDRFGFYSIGDLIAALESKLLYGESLIADNTASSTAAAASAAGTEEEPSTDNSYQNLSAQLNSYKPYRSKAELNAAIQDLILRLLARATTSGNYVGASDYFTAYATQVLQLAQAQGFAVNQQTLQNSLQYLRLNSKYFTGDSAAAFANEVLAQGESINQANLRYALDENQVKAPVMLAHLANALEQIGDHARAQKALDLAASNLLNWQQLQDELSKVDPQDRSKRYELLGQISSFNVLPETDIRHDAFVVIDACLRAGFNAPMELLLTKLQCLQEAPDYLSSLTMAAMLRANAHMTANSAQTAEQSAAAKAVDSEQIVLTKEQLAQLNRAQGAPEAAATSAETKTESKTETTAHDDSSADSTADSTANSTAGAQAAATPPRAQGESVPEAAPTAGDESVAGYTLADGKLTVHNRGERAIFVTTSVLGQYEHDNVMANNGVTLHVNYFNRDGALDVSHYQFRPNEEVLMEVNFTREVDLQSNPLLKVKLPAGFEYVRTAQLNDPVFGKLMGKTQVYSPEDLQVLDDMIVARYSRYIDEESMSMFVVLRAAHPGTFNQGEALMQLQSSPQIYGSFYGESPLIITEMGAN
ncbi:MAG: hypothetical protein H9847_08665 [Candidatus Anaerobiospirillum pullicola]|uniref:Alpha-2-macroglobulin domain-containing protein n=1 Tax=Candidatus Anaerobiospirillum pullicola TaxID=2838451 RepID=A0A948WYK9_9GAMM|nr:hypothetical protein [Candidatus Anaerobiospirillum pullicola]